jgi:perosamine synthetase
MDTSQSRLRAALLAGLQEVLGTPEAPISLHEPEFAGNEWTYVKQCLDTGWVSSAGAFVEAFEQRLVEFTGARHAVAVVNGTAALHLSLLVAGVRPGDEVLVPALSFVATANAVAHAGAIPHFVESAEDTLGLDPHALGEHLERLGERTTDGLRNRGTGRRISAIVPMHAFGHAVDLDGLMRVAGDFALPVVEDATEALGSTYRGRHTGTFGLMGVLSFNGNKIVTTGGGGAILTNDDAVARRARHLASTAKQPHRWAFVHDEVGYNYRLPNLNAALGCAQLERLPSFLARKRRLAGRYREAFARRPGLRFQDQPRHCESNFWLVAVRIDPPDAALRDALLGAAHETGYLCRPAWRLLHSLPMYRDCPCADLPVARAVEASLLNLPSSPRLAEVSA